VTDDNATYGLGERSIDVERPAPAFSYQPLDPPPDAPAIGLVGCGGISEQHLLACRSAGLVVSVLCDRDRGKAEARRREFYPDAAVTTDWRDAVGRDDVGVIDVTTHPEERPPIIEGALRAGKHVLSQKPFVTDLETGRTLCDLADASGLQLAVNQNGRWAPHFAWMRAAVAAGSIGRPFAIDVSIHWDHGWTAGTPFDQTPHLLLHDFGVHWFDAVRTLLPGRIPRTVTASVLRAPEQEALQPLLAQATITYDDARANLTFCGADVFHQRDVTVVSGQRGTLESSGPDLQQQTVRLFDAEGVAVPQLQGQWFPDGFRGAITELLCAISEGRAPLHGARDNLESLQLCWAACASSMSGRPEEPLAQTAWT